ncbi:MAG: hypothetical protein ACJA1F_000994 [Paracoccaceae bacterium]
MFANNFEGRPVLYPGALLLPCRLSGKCADQIRRAHQTDRFVSTRRADLSAKSDGARPVFQFPLAMVVRAI